MCRQGGAAAADGDNTGTDNLSPIINRCAVGRGERAAELLLLMGDNALCPDREGFTSDMIHLFRRYATATLALPPPNAVCFP